VAQAAYNASRSSFGQYMLPECSGISVWLPSADYFTDSYKLEYDALGFDDATGWLALLEATGVPGGGGGEEFPLLAWQPGYKIVATWDDPLVQINPFIEDPDGNFGSPQEPDMLAGIIGFSEDSSTSGVAEEWGELLPTAPPGTFYFGIQGDNAAGTTVSMHLEDEFGTQVYDFGTYAFDSTGSTLADIGYLFYNDGSADESAWVPGDYIKVSWTDIDADFDIYLEAPNGGYGWAYSSYGLDGIIEFSLESGESGLQLESATLLPGAPGGIYPVYVEFYDYAGPVPPPMVDVEVELFDAAHNLKHDFGTLSFDGFGYIDGQKLLGAVLTY
jgi:hypothetical protein